MIDRDDDRGDWLHEVSRDKRLDEIAALRDRVEELELALYFYGDASRYDNDTEIDRGDGTYDLSCSVLEDEGAIARAALEGKLIRS
jgi:hypothetical protein